MAQRATAPRHGNILVGSPGHIHDGTQADFHQLAAFFGQTRISLVGVQEDANRQYQTKYLKADHESVVPPKVPFGQEIYDGHGSRRQQLARWVAHPQNKPFARATVNRVWALVLGRPLVEPIDDLPLVGQYPPGLQLLADDFVANKRRRRQALRRCANRGCPFGSERGKPARSPRSAWKAPSAPAAARENQKMKPDA